MANKSTRVNNRKIQNIIDGISGNMDTLYRNTYMTTPQQGKDLQDLNNKINSSIDRIVNKNMDTVGMPSISKLYTRMANTGMKDQNDVISKLDDMFDNGMVTDDLHGLFMSNRFLRELDAEIDTVCKYMPKLEEALAVQKDSVLSADHFSKDFLNLTNYGAPVNETTFNERVKDLKVKYTLAKTVEEIYEDTSKYGEKFVYRVPYNIAIGRLLAHKPDGEIVSPHRGFHESYNDNSHEIYRLNLEKDKFKIYNENDEFISSNAEILTESVKTNSNGQKVTKMISSSLLEKDENFNINIEICKTNIIESAVLSSQNAFKKMNTHSNNSMASYYEQQIMNESKKDIQASGNISFSKKNKNYTTSMDGLVSGDKHEIVKVNTNGCVIKKLERDQVVPIYIEDMCMGYYYFELRSTDASESFMGFENILGDPLTNMKGDSRAAFNVVDNKRQDDTIKYVAGQLSNFIDKKFINNNQDLAKEIYMILKYNDLFNTPSVDTIKVTFIPPEDMVHFYFKQDPITHRGISDLEKALIPAKIYSSLYITTSIGKLTREPDKRVYYVKQNVDTNISQTLLNTISQIKQSNFGIRQFQSINNVLNISGRFNDYVIPTNASGDPPIQFEIMPGQNIDTPTELMESLEEMAINSTGIPIEIIQARQSIDYAMQLTMSSSKVLRFCYKRQELFQDLLNQFISPIYNYEYGENDTILVSLPPPSFINVTNTNQLVDNTKNFVQSIIEVEFPGGGDEDEALKNMYTKDLMMHYLGTHIDVSAHKEIYDRCILKAKKETDESHSNGGDSDY